MDALHHTFPLSTLVALVQKWANSKARSLSTIVTMYSPNKNQSYAIQLFQKLTNLAEQAPHDIAGTGSPVIPYWNKLFLALQFALICQTNGQGSFATTKHTAQCADNETESGIKEGSAGDANTAKDNNNANSTEEDEGNATGNAAGKDGTGEAMGDSTEEDMGRDGTEDDLRINGTHEDDNDEGDGPEKDGNDEGNDIGEDDVDEGHNDERGNDEGDDINEADGPVTKCDAGHTRCQAPQDLYQSLKKEQVAISEFYSELSLHKAVHKEQQDHASNRLIQILERDTTKQGNFNHTIRGLASIYLAERADTTMEGHISQRAFTRFWRDAKAGTIRRAIQLGTKIRHMNRLLPGLGMLAVLAKTRLKDLPQENVACFVAVVRDDTDLLKLIQPQADFDRAYLEFRQWIEPSTPFAHQTSARTSQVHCAKQPPPEVKRKVGRPRTTQLPPKVKRKVGRPRKQSSTDRLLGKLAKNNRNSDCLQGMQQVPSKRRIDSSTLPGDKRQRLLATMPKSSQRPPTDIAANTNSTVHDLQYPGMAPDMSANIDPTFYLENLIQYPGMASDMAANIDPTFYLENLIQYPGMASDMAANIDPTFYLENLIQYPGMASDMSANIDRTFYLENLRYPGMVSDMAANIDPTFYLENLPDPGTASDMAANIDRNFYLENLPDPRASANIDSTANSLPYLTITPDMSANVDSTVQDLPYPSTASDMAANIDCSLSEHRSRRFVHTDSLLQPNSMPIAHSA